MPEPTTYTQEELEAKLAEKTEGIRGELTAERAKSREAEKKLSDLQSDIDDLKKTAEKEKADKEKADLESKGKYEEALKKHQEESQKIIAERDKTIAGLKANLTTYRVDNAIMAAAGDAINPKQVVQLVKGEYQITEKDDGTVEILNGEGSPMLDKETGKPMDLKGVTGHFLAENKHLVKANTTGGTGTQTGGGGGVDMSKLSPVERLATAHEQMEKT